MEYKIICDSELLWSLDSKKTLFPFKFFQPISIVGLDNPEPKGCVGELHNLFSLGFNWNTRGGKV